MTQAIESIASLALAVKLKKIFDKEDKYLTFPTGLGFSYDYLEFMKDPSKTSLSAQEQLNYKGDFARLLNIIPEDSSIFSEDASRFLWDATIQTLHSCTYAESGLTNTEERQLSQAIDFLTDEVIDSDGMHVPVNSAAVNQYYQYKELYEEAERTYLDELLTVQNATGPDAQKMKQQWDAFREKQLREIKEKAEQSWNNLGFRQQVKYNQSLMNSLEIKKYPNLYGQAFLDEIAISQLADINGGGVGFYITFFSPSNAFDPNLPWTSITLTKQEIDSLVQQAPPDLKAKFGGDHLSSDIESISLEYNDVAILRMWFRPPFFESRYWKLPDTSLISDGRVPRQGMIPAFITSMIVARNVRITRRKVTGSQPFVLPLISSQPLYQFQTATIKPPVLISTPVRPVKFEPVVPGRPRGTFTPLGQEKPRAVIVPQSKASFLRMARPVGPVRSGIKSQPEAVAPTSAQQSFYLNAKYKGMAIAMPVTKTTNTVLPARYSRIPVSEAQTMTESFNLDGVSVLAFLCRRLPKSPNPDLTLKW